MAPPKKKPVDQLKQAVSAHLWKWTEMIASEYFRLERRRSGAMRQNLPVSGSILPL